MGEFTKSDGDWDVVQQREWSEGQQQIAQAAENRKMIRAAMRTYGKHLPGCDLAPACSCGLSAILDVVDTMRLD